MNPTTLGLFDLAARIALEADVGAWLFVGTDDPAMAAELVAEVEALVEHEIAMVSVDSGEALVASSRQHEARELLCVVTCPLAELRLDELRWGLRRRSVGVAVLSVAELSRLADLAPHFLSWSGNRVFRLLPDHEVEPAAKEQRLADLREHTGWNDAEFVEHVVSGDLRLEPHHAEWLVLLGRDDLLRSDS